MERNGSFPVFHQDDEMTAHKEMALQGMGISILPEFLIKNELKNGIRADLYPNKSSSP
jgi:DNA-binding transcriptional LysR family regulator